MTRHTACALTPRLSAPRVAVFARPYRRLLLLLFGLLSVVASAPLAPAAAATRPLVAVGAENEYGSVISQIGGRYVSVSSVMSNPSTDPHTFEASPSVARAISQAALVVQNGLGYDDFMERIEAASPSSSRKVIDVQKLLGLSDTTPNPHLWYDPKTMPRLAHAIATDLSALEPAHAAYFAANATAFDNSLKPWQSAIAALKKADPKAPVATTEPGR